MNTVGSMRYGLELFLQLLCGTLTFLFSLLMFVIILLTRDLLYLILALLCGFYERYGASFYFEVFSLNYSKRLLNQRTNNTLDGNTTDNVSTISKPSDDPSSTNDGKYTPNWKSLVSFVLFFVVFLVSFLISLKLFVL
jgi:hypothetical protein